MSTQLYSRDDLVDALARSEAPLTVLTGDSGVGKTRVLEAAAGARGGWVNSFPRRLSASSGAVQQALLEGLGDVVAQLIADRGSIEEIGERLAGAADRVLKENVRELGRVIGRELLEIVRSRLGPEFGNALAQYVGKLREEMDTTLATRLAAAADESTADVLAAFAREVAEFAEDRRIGLFFDVGERLNEEESRILADLSERLPARVHVRVAFATFDAESAQRVAKLSLLASRIHEIEVPPLDGPAVERWLADVGVQTSIARAMKVTAGYPLHIGDLVTDVKAGGTVDDVPLNQEVARRAEAAWRSLPPKAAAAARALCVLDDPLPEARLRELVGLDTFEFANVVEELVQARIFPTEANGRPWFHEQRRAFVRRKLSDDELDEASTNAADSVWAEFERTEDQRLTTQFAVLAVDAKRLRTADPKLDAALRLSEPEHAVMAALIELMTPQNRGAAEADELFRHARRFSDVTFEPLSVLGRLEEVGLVVTASNENATAVVPMLSAQAVAALQGGAYDRLKRTPIPQLTVLVLEVGIQPRLGAFTQARFGMGHPSIGGLARTAAGGDPEPGFGSIRPNRGQPGLHVLCRGHYAERPLWLIASYDEAEARDECLSNLAAVDTEVFGERLIVEETFSHPWAIVPAQRYVRAAARAAGLTSFEVRDTGDIRVPLSAPLGGDAQRELRVETAKLLRKRASNIERVAMELDQPFGLYWDEGDRTRIDCTVYGGAEKAVRVPGLVDVGLRESRYTFFEIEQRLDLDVAARLQNVTGGFGTREAVDPVFAEIARRRNRAIAFNSAQPKRRVALDPNEIEDLTREGFVRLMADARALGDLIVQDVLPLPPSALYVYVLIEPPIEGWKPGCASQVLALERESDSGSDEVHFHMAEGGVDVSGFMPRVTGDVEALFAAPFGFRPSHELPGFLFAGRVHDLDSLLSEYAGLHEDDLDLRWPERS